MILHADSTDKGKRLDLFLTEKLSSFSRSKVKKMILQGNVTVNGKTPTVHQFLHEGDEVLVIERTDTPPPIPDLPVIAKGKGYIVVDKPAGVLTHHAQSDTQTPTVTDWFVKTFPDSELIGTSDRPGIVHRLDRDTSGVLVIATTKDMLEHLKQQFHDRLVQKTYLALVHGNLAKKVGVIKKPIGRSKGESRMAARTSQLDDKDREAITEYEVIESFQNYDLVKASPKTGRTHQIRVHLFSIGHPIVGDRKYRRKRSKGDDLDRLFLHATHLHFTDINGDAVEVESPLPSKLSSYLTHLR